jgi:hypothetical protein
MEHHRDSVIKKNTTRLKIRPYSSEDKQTIREICKRTAFRNRGYELLFEDGELFADYWTEYYLKYESDLCFVAEKENKVVGYLLGCSDSRKFLYIMKKRILPKIIIKLIWRLLTIQYRNKKTYRYIYWTFVKSWREVLPIPYKKFPAHYHSNILPEGAFRQGFSQLLFRFLDELESRDIPGLYGIVIEPKDGGWFSKLAKKIELLGVRPEYFHENTSTLFRYVLKDKTPMVNRIFASSIDSYREFVKFVNKKYRW